MKNDQILIHEGLKSSLGGGIDDEEIKENPISQHLEKFLGFSSQ